MSATAGDPLLGELRGLLARLDPMPPQLLDQVRRSFCWRNVDAELAELSFDSLVDREPALAVRSDGGTALEPRMLGFGAVVDGVDVSIEIEVSTARGRCELIGQLWPAGATAVEIQSGDGAVAQVPVDELGRFVVAEVPRGPVRLCVRQDDRVVHTTWVSYASG
jgi:hypothetical protein